MPPKVPVVPFDGLLADPTVTWVVTASARAHLADLPVRGTMVDRVASASIGGPVVAFGGGTLIDRLKVWRVRERPQARLVAVPTIWGSGAEASPIAIVNGETGKAISIGPEYLPDARAYAPSIAARAPMAVRRAAIGDTVAHALEALLSPLGSPAVRTEAAAVLTTILESPSLADAEWFDLSAQACAAQAAASVGLVHGIAHQVEGQPGVRDGHAALCQTLLLPVFEYNLSASPKAATLLEQFGVPPDGLRTYVKALFDASVYDAVRGVIGERWPSVLRDACTRTNVALVRPASLEHFLQFIG